MKNIVALVSGRGSNLAAILQADIPGARFSAVISNRPDAGALAVARHHGVPAEVIDSSAFAARADFDAQLARSVAAHAPDLVVLAGFMRVLDTGFVQQYAGRMLNIHPSLLPLFPGLHTHRRALEAGVALHGATVHFVTPQLDAGPIIAQVAVPVLPGDDEATLAARVLVQEHRIYPQVVRWFVEEGLQLRGGRVHLSGLKHDAQAALCSPPIQESFK